MTIARFLLLVLLITPLLAAAGVYKWTDAQGKVHYSDSPPPETKAGAASRHRETKTGNRADHNA